MISPKVTITLFILVGLEVDSHTPEGISGGFQHQTDTVSRAQNEFHVM
jgi:hypothetical protein